MNSKKIWEIPIKDEVTEKEKEFPFDIQLREFNLEIISRAGYHNLFEIHFFLNGYGFYLIETKKYSFKPNSLIIIKPGNVHFFRLKKEVKKYSIYFDPVFFSDISNLFYSLPNIIEIRERDIVYVEMLCKKLFEEKKEKKELYLDFVRLKLHELFIIGYRSSLNLSEFVEDPKLEKILNFIEENYTKNIKIGDIAKTFYFSLSSFSHFFKNAIGMSPKQYIIQRRIIEAYRILTNEETKTKIVAQKVGFSNYKEFVNKFKKITGINPASVKKM